MAKRKAARGSRKAAAKTSRAKGRSSGRRPAAKAAKGIRRPARSSAKATPRPRRAARKPVKAKTSRKATRPAAAKTKAVKAPKRAARKTAAAKPRSAPRARSRAAVKAAGAAALRKAPALDRERRTIGDEEDEMVPMPPSTLDLDRSASAVRSGRRGMQQKFADHTETSPAMTAGDVDADWESAYSVGDEAPGGDNPTPDQDIVDDIGRAVGVQYDDNEELKGADKVAKRDAHRWELDPASAEDWDDRD